MVQSKPARSGHRPHPQTLAGLLDSAKEFLGKTAPPKGDFDPQGAWTQTFAVWLIGRGAQGGRIILKRAPLANQSGRFGLSVDWQFRQLSDFVHRVRADLVCQEDLLATPVSWQSESCICQQDKSLPQTAGKRQGDAAALDKGLTGRPWTSNFSLLEAVQRLGNRQIQPIDFTMLEFLDVRKDDQRLLFAGRQEVDLPGGRSTLTGYCHTGTGVLPEVYWLDDRQRLRFIQTALRAFIAVGQEVQP